MTPEQKHALRNANAGVNSVKSALFVIYDRLASAGCEREAETLRNVCRNLEDRQAAWARRMER